MLCARCVLVCCCTLALGRHCSADACALSHRVSSTHCTLRAALHHQCILCGAALPGAVHCTALCLPCCTVVVGRGQWAVVHCLTAWRLWAVELLLRTAALPGGSGECNSCFSLPLCLSPLSTEAVHNRCGVVWCGVVWCGVVWCGVVWCGVVWCGVVWCGAVSCGVVWCGVVWCGVVRCGAVWCGVVWCGVVWCGVVWCGVVWRGVVWCGVVWCGVAWRGVAWRGVVWCGVVWCGVVWCGVAWRGVAWCGVVWCGAVRCGAVRWGHTPLLWDRLVEDARQAQRWRTRGHSHGHGIQHVRGHGGFVHGLIAPPDLQLDLPHGAAAAQEGRGSGTPVHAGCRRLRGWVGHGWGVGWRWVEGGDWCCGGRGGLLHWKARSPPPPPSSGAQPMPSHCLPDGKRQPQWQL